MCGKANISAWKVFNTQLGRLQVKPPSCKIKHAKMMQQINEGR